MNITTIVVGVVGALIGLAFIVLFVSIFRVHDADEDLRKRGLID